MAFELTVRVKSLETGEGWEQLGESDNKRIRLREGYTCGNNRV